MPEELRIPKKEVFNLRFQQATGQLENTAQVRKEEGSQVRQKP